MKHCPLFQKLHTKRPKQELLSFIIWLVFESLCVCRSATICKTTALFCHQMYLCFFTIVKDVKLLVWLFTEPQNIASQMSCANKFQYGWTNKREMTILSSNITCRKSQQSTIFLTGIFGVWQAYPEIECGRKLKYGFCLSYWTVHSRIRLLSAEL